jgi:probable F420-dependent oxidoreductase
MRPFRFAVQSNGTADAAAWRAHARKVEDLGYSTLYLPDHFTEQWGPLVALTVAAEATSTLNVGSLVFDNDYRHPVVLAKEVATLDLVSEGRVELGLGAGWMRTDYDQSGIPFDDARVRIDRLEEALEIYRQLLAEGEATFRGEHYQVDGVPGLPRPASDGGPRLIVGGGGKRVLSLAARHADIVGVNPSLHSGAADAEAARSSVASRFDERVAWVREAAGERADEIELQLLTFHVDVGGDRAATAAALGPAMGLGEEEAFDLPLALVGSVDDICEQLVERRERWGFSYVVVHDPDVDAFAEVVARLAGT